MGAREWKDLKAKQKQKLSEVMFGVVCAHYKEHGQMPAGAELEKLAKAAFTKICLLYTSPSPRDYLPSRMPSSA